MSRKSRVDQSIIDPIVALAFAVHASPGGYVLLLGSGVSSSAGVPTGWAIVLDLIRRIAAAEKKNAGEDPESWYAKRFGEAPKYSALLGKLAKTASDRQALLRRYIEPTEDQRRAGLRVPTKAHQAIARLVAAGYVRLILTTNFDRLIEQALEESGISPDVVDGVDALRGARPISQSSCVVVKLHGDYRDARVRNTPAELQSYEPQMDAFLDRILDEHGLIVCGWSAEWDEALRAAITRQPNRRFATYWSTRGELTEHARELIERRGAVVVPDRDAEQLFVELESKIDALRELDRPHPLSVATAMAELKRYLPDPQARIRLDDLVQTETERVVEAISDEHFPVQAPGTDDEVRRRIAQYQATVEILIGLCAIGSYYSNGVDQDRLWARAVARVANHEGGQSGLTAYLALRRYPAVLCFYAGGIAAVGAENWSTLRELFLGNEFGNPRQDNPIPLVGAMHPWTSFENVDSQSVLHPTHSGGKLHTPISDHLHEVVRQPLKSVIPSDVRFTEIFDRFEFVLGMVLADLAEHPTSDGYMLRTHIGSFAWRYGRGQRGSPWDWVQGQLSSQGDNWPVLRSGLFGGSPERLEAALKMVVEATRRRDWAW